MPLTKEQSDALAALFDGDEAPLKDATPEDIAADLKAKAPAVHTLVFNEGFNKQTGTTPKKLAKLQEKLTAAEAEKERLEGLLGNGNPEIEKVRKDAKDEVERIRKEMKEKEEAWEKQQQDATLKSYLDTFQALLADKKAGSLRPSAAKYERHNPDLVGEKGRIRLVDGQLVVMQAGKEIPIAADDDTPEAMLRALAIETRKRLEKEDPDAIVVDLDNGAGVLDTTGGGGEQGYDPEKEGKEMAARQKGERDRNKNVAFT